MARSALACCASLCYPLLSKYLVCQLYCIGFSVWLIGLIRKSEDKTHSHLQMVSLQVRNGNGSLYIDPFEVIGREMDPAELPFLWNTRCKCSVLRCEVENRMVVPCKVKSFRGFTREIADTTNLTKCTVCQGSESSHRANLCLVP